MEQPQIFSLGRIPEHWQKTLQPHYSLTKVSLIIDRKDSACSHGRDSLRNGVSAGGHPCIRNHLSEYQFCPLKNMHFPKTRRICIIARSRFVFDEFFFFLLSMQL